MPSKKLFSTQEAAREVGGITADEVAGLIRDGQVGAEMIAGRWVLDQSGLDDLASVLEAIESDDDLGQEEE